MCKPMGAGMQVGKQARGLKPRWLLGRVAAPERPLFHGGLSGSGCSASPVPTLLSIWGAVGCEGGDALTTAGGTPALPSGRIVRPYVVVYSPPTVSPSMRIVGAATAPRNSRSFAISE